ncbi:hypothetical protein HDU76_006436, partial [Blyttiomyces sp. JEL0837]
MEELFWPFIALAIFTILLLIALVTLIIVLALRKRNQLTTTTKDSTPSTTTTSHAIQTDPPHLSNLENGDRDYTRFDSIDLNNGLDENFQPNAYGTMSPSRSKSRYSDALARYRDRDEYLTTITIEKFERPGNPIGRSPSEASSPSMNSLFASISVFSVHDTLQAPRAVEDAMISHAGPVTHENFAAFFGGLGRKYPPESILMIDPAAGRTDGGNGSKDSRYQAASDGRRVDEDELSPLDGAIGEIYLHQNRLFDSDRINPVKTKPTARHRGLDRIPVKQKNRRENMFHVASQALPRKAHQGETLEERSSEWAQPLQKHFNPLTNEIEFTSVKVRILSGDMETDFLIKFPPGKVTAASVCEVIAEKEGVLLEHRKFFALWVVGRDVELQLQPQVNLFQVVHNWHKIVVKYTHFPQALDPNHFLNRYWFIYRREASLSKEVESK